MSIRLLVKEALKLKRIKKITEKKAADGKEIPASEAKNNAVLRSRWQDIEKNINGPPPKSKFIIINKIFFNEF